MKISYIREMKRSYLTIETEDEEQREKGAWEAGMLEQNRIRGLLPMRVRYEEGREIYCYDITSRQPLERILETHAMTGEQVRSLFWQLYRALEEMEKYLLESGGILLTPELIYAEPERFEIGLCAVPGGKGDFAAELSHFLQYLLKHVDHTLLTQTATWAEIRQICDDAIKYGTASVCIPPAYVKQVKEYVKDQMQVCTVIGFPNGYMTTATKEFETKDALANGADEIDMVINIGWAKDGKFDAIEEEIRTLKKACGSKILKVIIETCLLTDEEKKAMCKAVTAAGADYIKTSTGFSKAGATFEDIKLFSEHIGPNVKMKAAGGISSLDDAEKFLSLGADRLGTSRIVKIVKQEEATGY